METNTPLDEILAQYYVNSNDQKRTQELLKIKRKSLEIITEESSKEEENIKKIDPLLEENTKRFVYLPIVYPTIDELYKTLVATTYTIEELDLDIIKIHNIDMEETNKMLDIIISMIFKLKNYYREIENSLLSDLQSAECRFLVGKKISNGNLYQEGYGLLLNSISKSLQDRYPITEKSCEKYIKKSFDGLYSLLQENYIDVWMDEISGDKIQDKSKRYIQNILFLSCVETIGRSTLYIFNKLYNDRNDFNGINSNNLSYMFSFFDRDYEIYLSFYKIILQLSVEKLDHQYVSDVVKRFVENENKIVEHIFADSLLLGITKKDIILYNQYLADELMVFLNYPTIFNTKYPFSFILDSIIYGKETKQSTKKDFWYNPQDFVDYKDRIFEISTDF